jgi:hypothetical protein
MSNRLCVPLPDGRWLALDRETFAAALVAGAEMTAGSAPSPASVAEPLLDANQAAAQMNVSARWLEDSARAGIIPHIKLGKFNRFRVSEIAARAIELAFRCPLPQYSTGIAMPTIGRIERSRHVTKKPRFT